MNRKSLFILLFIVFLSSSGYAQTYIIEKIYLPATGLEIGFYVDAEKPKYIYYDMKTDNTIQKAQARISMSEVKMFISSLQKAKDKYEKWAKVAKKEGARTVSKRIPQLFRDQTIYFTDDGKWFREKGVNMKSMISVDNYGDCFFVLQSDNMESDELVGETSSIGGSYAPKLNIGNVFGASSQVTVKHFCQGASLIFQSTAEIDDFINKLRIVLAWKDKNKSQKKIFK